MNEPHHDLVGGTAESHIKWLQECAHEYRRTGRTRNPNTGEIIIERGRMRARTLTLIVEGIEFYKKMLAAGLWP